jgi:transcriptional regulator with XRE-family HTH domain
MSLKVAFGARVRQLRIERGLSQESLADLADLHATFISKVERGVQNVSLLTVERLAKALKVRPAELFR